MTLNNLYAKGKQILKESGIKSYSFDTCQIMKKVLNVSRHDIIVNGKELVLPENEKEFFRLLNQRKNGRPLQYIVGQWEFMGLDFVVGEGVLVPRDDTQVLVNTCEHVLKSTNNPRVLDLCSGSGNVCIAIESIIKKCSICAVEISTDAIDFLTCNIKINKSKNITVLHDDVLNPAFHYQSKSFDLIVSNPPYIKSCDIDFLQKEVQNEPRLALDGGVDGLDFYRAFVNNFMRCLKHGGHICVEVGYDQSLIVEEMFKSCAEIDCVYTVTDINNIGRVVVGRVKSK